MIVQLCLFTLWLSSVLQANLNAPRVEVIEDGSGTNTSYILKLAMRLSVKQTTTVDPIAEMYRTMSGFTQPQLATESAFSDDFTKIIKRRHAATERFMMNPSLSPTTPAKFLKVSLQQHLANHNGTDAGETLRLMRLMAATATGDATLDQLSACACDCPVPSRRRMKKSSSPAGCPNYPCLNGGIYFSMNNGRDCGCQCKPGYYGVHCHKRQKPTSMTNCQCENGGECVAVQKRKLCHCPLGYMGDQCQYRVQVKDRVTPPPIVENLENLMLCTDNPCLNDGICLKNLNELKTICYCRPGFGGNRCQQAMLS